MRSVSVADARETPRERERDRDRDHDKDTITSSTYDQYGNRARSHPGSRTSSQTRESRTESRNDLRDSNPRTENGHWRNNSTASTNDYVETQGLPQPRRHDYDVHSMEGEVRIGSVSHPIPAPTVTVRSEFPTLNRSKVQQSLTCLVTVEVPERKSNNFADDVPSVPSTPQQFDRQYQPPSPTNNSQYSFEGQESISTKPRDRDIEREREQELLANITEELRLRVENWHGLDFNRFVNVPRANIQMLRRLGSENFVSMAR